MGKNVIRFFIYIYRNLFLCWNVVFSWESSIFVNNIQQLTMVNVPCIRPHLSMYDNSSSQAFLAGVLVAEART